MKRMAALIVLIVWYVFALAQSSTDTPARTGAPQPSDPRSRAKIHTDLGAAYLQDGKMAIALEELRMATTADPGYAPAYNVLGLIHMYLRENLLAEDSFRQALRLAPDDSDILNNYGWFLCQTSREKESVAYFLKALKNPLYSTPIKPYLNAGMCSARARDDVAAEDYLIKALRYEAKHPQALFELAEINLRKGKLSEAKRFADELAHQVDASAETLWLQLRIERQLGDAKTERILANQLRRKFAQSDEYQKLLKGQYE